MCESHLLLSVLMYASLASSLQAASLPSAPVFSLPYFLRNQWTGGGSAAYLGPWAVGRRYPRPSTCVWHRSCWLILSGHQNRRRQLRLRLWSRRTDRVRSSPSRSKQGVSLGGVLTAVFRRMRFGIYGHWEPGWHCYSLCPF